MTVGAKNLLHRTASSMALRQLKVSLEVCVLCVLAGVGGAQRRKLRHRKCGEMECACDLQTQMFPK